MNTRALLRAGCCAAALLLPLAAHAQVTTPSMLGAALTVNLTDIVGLEQGSTGPGTGAPRKATIQQIANAVVTSNLTVTGTDTYTALQTFSAGAVITGLSLGLTAHGVLLAEGSGNVVATAVPAAGQILVGQGASADPSPQTVGGDCTMSAAAALTCFAVTPASVAKGGTGNASLNVHGLLVGEGTSAVAAMSAMSAGTLVIGQGVSADPAAVTVSGDATLASTGALTVSAASGVPLACSTAATDKETAGSSKTVAAGVRCVILDGVAATYTLTMPAAPTQGWVIELRCGTAVTTLTVSGNTGQTMKGSPSACSTTQGHRFSYDTTGSTANWYMDY